MCVRFLTAVLLVQVHNYITKQHFVNSVAFLATSHSLCHLVLSVAMLVLYVLRYRIERNIFSSFVSFFQQEMYVIKAVKRPRQILTKFAN